MGSSAASAASESLSNQGVVENPLSSNSVRSRPKANDFKDMTNHPTRKIPTARWASWGYSGPFAVGSPRPGSRPSQGVW